MGIERKRVLILGAGGRDFHNFNCVFRNNPYYQVVGFTAAQIPGIAGRTYPPELAGPFYPGGVPIHGQEELAKLIAKHRVDKVVFAYSDVSHEYVMHVASEAMAGGADFWLIGPHATMLKSRKKVVAVTAVRTGSGKSQTTRRLIDLLRHAGKKVVAIRHPMPYGQLSKQIQQRFASFTDLEEQQATIEEREEYEPIIRQGAVVFAGVDYEKILKAAEKEADVIIWDGGNNDTPFIKPDLHLVVVDPLRAGHEVLYHPGETNFRMADAILVNKMNVAGNKDVQIIEGNAKTANPAARILYADSELIAPGIERVKGKKVLVVEDGPTVTHGGLNTGAATVLAKKFKAKIVSPERWATGSIRETFNKYRHLKNILPAMGYGKEQLKELENTINAAKVDYVIIGTPIALEDIISINKPSIHVRYELKERTGNGLKKLLKEFKLV